MLSAGDPGNCRVILGDRQVIQVIAKWSGDEYAVSWLTSYGSWHAYKKKPGDPR